MNRQAIFVITLLLVLLCSNTYGAQGGGNPPPAALDDAETAHLVFMREEEKLARDTYITLHEAWGRKVFSNIASSEQRHMDTMLKKLNFFGISDPVVSDEAGSFSNTSLDTLYPQLIERGEDSPMEALQVGAFVEETDIRDLRQAIDDTNEPVLFNAYSNLLAASRNHLRTFVSHLENLGVDYQAQVLGQADVDDIVGDYDLMPGQNFTINAGLNDAWYFPDTNGQGFMITVFPKRKRVFLAWFTFDTQLPAEGEVAYLGAPGQRWMTAQGSYGGALAELEIDVMSGGIFDASDPLPGHNASGSILLQFDNCTKGSVTYDIPSIDSAGIVPIERIAPDNVSLCQELNAVLQ